jgi:hypothetical protein
MMMTTLNFIGGYLLVELALSIKACEPLLIILNYNEEIKSLVYLRERNRLVDAKYLTESKPELDSSVRKET